MTGIKVPVFGGMRPRAGDQLLGNQNAELAQNALLLSGEARGLHAPITLKEFVSTNQIEWAFRILLEAGGDAWIGFEEERVDLVGGPLVEDEYGRQYFTRTGKDAQFTTEADIITADAAGGLQTPVSYPLGVPPPFDPNDEDADPPVVNQWFINSLPPTPPDPNDIVFAIDIEDSSRVLIGGNFTNVGIYETELVARFKSSGGLDENFIIKASGGSVLAVRVQPLDGKVVMGGSFTTVEAASHPNLVRLTASGVVDITFDPDVNGTINDIVILESGQMYIGGSFTLVDGVSRVALARLEADGSLDLSFDASTISDPTQVRVRTIAVLSDDKLIIGGDFDTVASTARNNIAKVESNGAIVAAFDPDADDHVYAIVIHEDVGNEGRITVAGAFLNIVATLRSHIARLNADGTLEVAFDPNANSTVRALTLLSDGEIIMGGQFTIVTGTARRRLAKLGTDGVLDPDWNPTADSYVHALGTQYDDSVIVGGSFLTIAGVEQPYVARVDINGNVDRTFNPEDTDLVTRAYVITLVNIWGEESAPTIPAVVEGYETGGWELFGLYIDAADIALYSLEFFRIYRTITGASGVTDYFFVAELSLVPFTAPLDPDPRFTDNNKSIDVALNDILDSYNFNQPIDGLTGLIAHPSGFLVGFKGHSVYFSVPFRPHAWPIEYAIAIEHNVVGLAVFGSAILILTDGHPYLAAGTNPAGMGLTKYQTASPCVSYRGIVPIIGGVIYPSFEGLMIFSTTGAKNLSRPYLTKDEWQAIDIHSIRASREEEMYIAFYGDSEGFMFSPSEPISGFSMLTNVWHNKNIQIDDNSGKVHLLHYYTDGVGTDLDIVSEWNPTTGYPLNYYWLSKEFVTDKPVNLGAMQLDWFKQDGNELDSRIIGGGGVGANPKEITYVAPPRGYDLSNDYNVNAIMEISIWADGYLRYVGNVTTLRTIKLPSGYKATRWQILVEGNGRAANLRIAETGTSLAAI